MEHNSIEIGTYCVWNYDPVSIMRGLQYNLLLLMLNALKKGDMQLSRYGFNKMQNSFSEAYSMHAKICFNLIQKGYAATAKNISLLTNKKIKKFF